MGRHMLFVAGDGIQTLRRHVACNADAARQARTILTRAEAMLTEEVIAPLFDATRPILLTTARQLADRVHFLGIAWFLTGQPRFRARLAKEALAASGFEHWNRVHFLDVAEMAAAVSLAYEWTQAILSSDERRRIEAAIHLHALKPGLSSLRSKTEWTRRANNWNLVCCSGLVLAALTLSKVHAAEALELLERAVDAMRLGLANYGSEGGWDEGVSYWEYGTRFAVLALAALEDRSPERMQALDISGLLASWRFGRAMTTPAGRSVNIGDSELRTRRLPVYGWLAARGGGAEAGRWQNEAPGAPHPLDLLWPGPGAGQGGEAPATEIFNEAGYAALRFGHSGYLAVRAGRNRSNHAHLDLGSFVYESDGAMLVADPGRGDYSAPGYFRQGERETHPNVGTAVHSTIRFDGHSQSLDAQARFIACETVAGSPRLALVIDDPVAPCLHFRAFALEDRCLVTVDRIVPRPGGVCAAFWSMTTAARVECRPDAVHLVTDSGGYHLAWEGTGAVSAFSLHRPVASVDHGNDVLMTLERRIPVERESWILASLCRSDAKDEPRRQSVAEHCRRWLAQVSDPVLT